MKRTAMLMLTAFILSLTLPATIFSAEIEFLKQEFITLEKPNRVVVDGTVDYLRSLPEDSKKIWVFFTDKGVSSTADFRNAAGQVQLTDKALERRAKVGKNEITFADLPLVKEYLSQIENLGAELKRESRWLNAASFVVSESIIEEIASLPFVYEIRPVARFIRDFDPVEPIPSTYESENNRGFETDRADVLNYGPSINQLEQIGVPQVHNMGYSGDGVIVAMFDTGYRKTHQAFAQHYIDGRVLAEYDFVNDDGNVQNELGDIASQHNHGTYIWSSLGGFAEGEVVGPAYGASFILAKTEDVSDETQVEEDNWVAALEWVDSIGAEVVSSSLAYSLWYDYEDFDGNTATITLAANTAAGLGIVVCNAMANSGPTSGSLHAPADAYDILAVGAVDSLGTIASFSSRGPTYDSRIKPEVCAQGISTRCALGESDLFYGYRNGTSLSTPLVGGATALLIEARPSLTPTQIRQAFMETADNADSPNNTYGWGVLNVEAALGWGADFSADTTFAHGDLTVNFTDVSPVTATSWKWSFGDGDSSDVQNPSHTYTDPGFYDVTLVTQTADGELSKTYENFVRIIPDTIKVVTDSVYAGEEGIISIHMTNTQELKEIVIPITYAGDYDAALTVERGSRTDYFEELIITGIIEPEKKFAIRLISCPDDVLPMLQPGSGEIARIRVQTDSTAISGESVPIDTSFIPFLPLEASNPDMTYPPAFEVGEMVIKYVLRGDADNNLTIDILDILHLIDYKFQEGPPPLTIQSGDADNNQVIDILDIIYLIDYKFNDGPAPDSP